MKYEIHYRNCNTLDELQFLVDDYMCYHNNYRCQ
nr:hypothetical protein [Terrisporobacter petrolearius]